MPDAYKIWNICPQCKGAGTILDEQTEIDSTDTVGCPLCSGEKYVLTGYCTTDTFTIGDLPT